MRRVCWQTGVSICSCYVIPSPTRNAGRWSKIALNHPPQPKILEMSMLGRPCAAVGIHEELNSEDGPYALLQKAADMIGFELRSIGRSARAS